MAENKPAKIAPDWERIETDYRAGILSLREIATKDGNVTEGAIRKKAKVQGWTRDLSAKIKAKADDLVRKEEVRTQVRSETAANERQAIEASAQAIAAVRLNHRGDIKRARELVIRMLEELELQTGKLDEFDKLGELMYAPNENGIDKLNELYRKVISLSGRVSNVKALSDALKNLIGLEREAWGLNDLPTEGAGAGRELSDVERATRLASILARARARAAAAGEGGD